MMSIEAFTKIINFMTPKAGVLVIGCGHISLYGHIEKMYHFFENLLYSCASSRKTEYIVMISMEASTKIINFLTPGSGVLVIGCAEFQIEIKCYRTCGLLASKS